MAFEGAFGLCACWTAQIETISDFNQHRTRQGAPQTLNGIRTFNSVERPNGERDRTEACGWTAERLQMKAQPMSVSYLVVRKGLENRKSSQQKPAPSQDLLTDLMALSVGIFCPLRSVLRSCSRSPLARCRCEASANASCRDTPIVAWHAVPGKRPQKEPSRRVRCDRIIGRS